MLKKARVSMELGVPAIIFKPEQGKPTVEATITLELFEVKDNRVVWIMRDNKGQITEGRAKEPQKLRIYDESWVVLSMPITVHVFENLCPEFIFGMPSSRRILTTRKFKEEFPGQAVLL